MQSDTEEMYKQVARGGRKARRRRSNIIAKIYEYTIYLCLLELGFSPDHIHHETEIMRVGLEKFFPSVNGRQIVFIHPDFLITTDGIYFIILVGHCETKEDSHNKFFQTIEELSEFKRWQAATGKRQKVIMSIHGEDSIHGNPERGFREYVIEFFKWGHVMSETVPVRRKNEFFDYSALCFDTQDQRNLMLRAAVRSFAKKDKKGSLIISMPKNPKKANGFLNILKERFNGILRSAMKEYKIIFGDMMSDGEVKEVISKEIGSHKVQMIISEYKKALGK